MPNHNTVHSGDRWLSGKWRRAPWFVCVWIAAPLFGSGPLCGQQQPTISVEVKEVTLYATVRDKHGKIIANLNKDNFALDEDGRPQTIAYFARESDLPLTLGLLVDTSMSQRGVLDQERSASYDFLDHMVREDKDKAFLIHFDREVELLEELTSSRAKLRSALDLLQTPDRDRASGSGGGYGHGRGGAGTLLYDAIYLAANELMTKQQGRKALIILTDGVDHGSKETIGTAIEAAQRADTSVFSILFAGQEGYDRGGSYGNRGGWAGRPGGGPPRRYPQEERPDGKKVLERISKETGGEFFQVSKKDSIGQIYAQIEDGLRNQYSLSYTPDRANPGPGYHKIQLVTKQKDFVVQARDGYYSEK
jgi:VWFA-related protein